MQSDLPLFQRRQLEVIARVTPHAMAGHILNTSVLAIALAGSVPTADLAVWCTYSYGIALLVLYRHARNRGRAPTSFRRAAHRATVYAFLLALPWSTMTVMHLGALGREQELILIALVVGMAASGTVLLSALPSAAFSYMSGILIPGAVKCLFLLDQKVYLLLGVLAVSYWWFLAALITKVAREISERQKADVALRESETRLQEALTAGQVVAFSWDPGTGHSHRSENALQILGLGPQNGTGLPGNDFLARVHPDDRQSFVAQIKRLSPQNPSYSAFFRFTRPDGQQAWLEETGKAEFDADDGRYLRLRGLTRDITERKQAEEKLHERERELRVLLEALAERTTQLALAGKAARVGSFAVDYATERIQTSPGYAAIHGLAEGTEGYPRAEWRARVHPGDLARLDALRSQAFAERRREHHIEYRIVGEDGEPRWIESRGLVSYDGGRRPTRLVGVHIDITERKRAQAAIEESEARYRALYDDNPSMYFTVDAAGTVLSVNEFGARELGYTPAELVGQSVLEMVHEGDREKAQRWLASCKENGGTISRAEMRKVRRDGSTLWVRKSARTVDGSRGRMLLIVCEDITERKRVEEQQGKLLAELDHRVKNVLATVQAVAAHTMQASGSMEHFVAALDGRIRSMASTHELLSHRRWLGIPLAALVERELAPYTTGSNTEIDGPEVMLSAEAGQTMGMVLHELVTNAAKHGALSVPSGRVSIRWRLPLNDSASDRLVLTWRETGGPLVVAPSKSGYGMDVVRSVIPYELGGTVDHALAPEGARCKIEIPLAELSGGSTKGKESASAYSLHAPHDIGRRRAG